MKINTEVYSGFQFKTNSGSCFHDANKKELLFAIRFLKLLKQIMLSNENSVKIDIINFITHRI